MNKLKQITPKFLKTLIKAFLSFVTWDPWFVRSWSQEGEDQILCRIFEGQKGGFYIDIGAHHPKRFSNTYLFYHRAGIAREENTGFGCKMGGDTSDRR